VLKSKPEISREVAYQHQHTAHSLFTEYKRLQRVVFEI
jgi:hypothetical protein